jgi:hypothetical protein
VLDLFDRNLAAKGLDQFWARPAKVSTANVFE